MAADLPARVARAIADIRKARGMSQEGLAGALAIAVKNLQRIESGRQNLTLTSLDRIATALDVDVAAFFRAVPAEREPSTLDRLKLAGFEVRPSSTRGKRPEGAIPITTLRAAAGALTGEAHVPGTLGWVVSERSTRPDQFIAEVRGQSMEPRLPSGSLVLFGPANGPPYGQRIFLLTSSDLHDEELGGPFVVKRIRRTAKELRLESINASYAPLVFRENVEAIRAIAEVVRVLVPGRPR